MREQFTKELKKYNTELLSNNPEVKHSLASVFMRGLIHSDDQSYWRSPAVQSLDNETDVMRLDLVFFSGHNFFFRSDLVGKELGSIAIGRPALHCHCFDPPHHQLHLQDHQLKSQEGFLSRNRSGREYQRWLWLDKPALPAKVVDPRRSQKLMLIPKSALWATLPRGKSARLQMAGYGKHKMVCT